MLHPRMNIPTTLSSLHAVTRIYRRPPKFAILVAILHLNILIKRYVFEIHFV